MSERLAETMDQISQFLSTVGRSEDEEESAELGATSVLRSLQQRGDGRSMRLSVQATRGDGAGAGARRDELVTEDMAASAGPSMDKIAQLKLVLILY